MLANLDVSDDLFTLNRAESGPNVAKLAGEAANEAPGSGSINEEGLRTIVNDMRSRKLRVTKVKIRLADADGNAQTPGEMKVLAYLDSLEAGDVN